MNLSHFPYSILYQFLFNDHVYSTSNVLVPFFNLLYLLLINVSLWSLVTFITFCFLKLPLFNCQSWPSAILCHVSFFQFASTSIYFNYSVSYQFILNINLFFLFIQFYSISICLLFLQFSVSFMAFWHICSKMALLTPSCFVTFLFLKFPLIF